MKMRLLCFLLFSCAAAEAAVQIKDRNIFYENKGKTKRITSAGRDEAAKLNPAREWIYFVRDVEGKWVGERYFPPKGVKNKDRILKQELWRVKTDGTCAKMLFRSERASIDGPDPDCAIATVGNIQFSPSGDKVYFETSEWVASAGLHVMNAEGSHERLLGGGNGTRILISASGSDKGKNNDNYQGYIVTNQHRYWLFGGSYDWYWLFTPDFKEVGALGEDFASFTELGDMKYTDQSPQNPRNR